MIMIGATQRDPTPRATQRDHPTHRGHLRQQYPPPLLQVHHPHLHGLPRVVRGAAAPRGGDRHDLQSRLGPTIIIMIIMIHILLLLLLLLLMMMMMMMMIIRILLLLFLFVTIIIIIIIVIIWTHIKNIIRCPREIPYGPANSTPEY